MKPNYTMLYLLALLGLAACTGGDIEPGRTEPEPTVISDLQFEKVAPAQPLARRALSGTVEAVDRSRLLARLPGRIEKILVKEGQTVVPGETLLMIGDQTVTDEMAAARSAVRAAESHLEEAESHQQFTARTLERYNRLRAGRAVTPQEYDQVANEAQSAQQRRAAAAAQLARARANLDAARTMADQARVSAPFAGRIIRLLVDAGSTVMPGTPLVLIDRTDAWQISLELPEHLAGDLQSGTSLTVEIPARNLQFQAILAEVYPAADPVSRTLTAKLDVPPEIDLQAGLFARVFLPAGDGEILLVPSSAIVTRGQLTGVYVAAGTRLQYRQVRTGRDFGDRTEILAGLDPEEVIVVEGTSRARHGGRIKE